MSLLKASIAWNFAQHQCAVWYLFPETSVPEYTLTLRKSEEIEDLKALKSSDCIASSHGMNGEK